jgi:hypothetical protein
VTPSRARSISGAELGAPITWSSGRITLVPSKRLVPRSTRSREAAFSPSSAAAWDTFCASAVTVAIVRSSVIFRSPRANGTMSARITSAVVPPTKNVSR